jgi:acyl carrier protein
MNENNSIFNNIISNVLNIDIKTINNNISPINTPSWDSFNALLLLSEIESEFNISINIAEFSQIKDLSDLKSVLKKYNIIID